MVSKVLATANKNGSQITFYTVNGGWLFITYHVLKPIDHMIFVLNVMLQKLRKLQHSIVKSDGEYYSLTIGQTLFSRRALILKAIMYVRENSSLTMPSSPM